LGISNNAMTFRSAIDTRVSTTVANTLLAVTSLGFAWASYATYSMDHSSRIAEQRFAVQYAMPIRRPEIVKSLEYAPSGDFAADLVADATLQDVAGPVELADLSAQARAAWLDAVPKYDEQMAGAANLALDAIAARPGWPYHSSLLGQLFYLRQARSLSPDLVRKHDLWSKPLYIAATDAATDNSLWQSLAVAELQTWPELGNLHVKTALSVFRHAFEDPDFVASTFGPAVNALGKDAALQVLPDRAEPLHAALQVVGKGGDVLAAWSIHQRWDAAEWRERADDLAAIQVHAARGDIDETRGLCVRWMSVHSVWDYDSKVARAQNERLMEIWPVGKEGRWTDDPRAQIVRYFLSGRTDGVKGSVLLRTIDSLAGVPVPIVAQIHVLAGDLAGAESIAKSSDSFGTFEWTPYVVELARRWNAQGDKTRARAAIAQLAPAARDECNVLVARREIDGRETVAVDSRDLSSQSMVGTPIALCMDQGTRLNVRVTSADPFIVDYGWDGARSASALVTPASLSLTLAAPPGMRQLMTRSAIAGAAAEVAVRKF
jgi:hypothetical protein